MDDDWSLLRCEAIAWAERDWPGWLKVRLVDADGRERFIVDKAPIFMADLGPDYSNFPIVVHLRCDIVGTADDGQATGLIISRICRILPASVVEMERQDQCGGDRQFAVEHLVARDEDHGLALAEHHVILTRIGGATEDMDADGVREALLIWAWAGP